MHGELEKRRVGFKGGLFIYDRVIFHQGGSIAISNRYAPWWPFREGTLDLHLINLYEAAVQALEKYHMFEIWALRYPETNEGYVYLRLEFDLTKEIPPIAKVPKKRWLARSIEIYFEDFLAFLETMRIEHRLVEIEPEHVYIDFPVDSPEYAASLGQRLHGFIFSTNLTAAVKTVWMTRQ